MTDKNRIKSINMTDKYLLKSIKMTDKIKFISETLCKSLSKSYIQNYTEKI